MNYKLSQMLFCVFFMILTTLGAKAGELVIMWNANKEIDLAGYRIHYGTASGEYNQSIYVGKYTSYHVEDLENGARYYMAVTAVDYAGNESAFSEEVSGIAHSSVLPAEDDALFVGNSYNFPNPFSVGERTAIKYEISQNSHVTIKIFDLDNRLIITLLQNEYKLVGEHIEDQWDGLNSFGQPVANGVYLCRIDIGNQQRVIKIAVTP